MSASDTANNPPPVAIRIADLRDLVNNQNVNGLSAGQATAVARELDAIVRVFEGEAGPPAPAPPPAPEPESPQRRGRRI